MAEGQVQDQIKHHTLFSLYIVFSLYFSLEATQ